MAAPTLIYCGGGNRRFYEIARNAGFEYGARLPDTIYGPLYFADQDWRLPRRAAYMAAVAEYKPHMASVIDWECADQLPDVLDWADEISQHIDVVMIIPKVMGGIDKLPRMINGKQVRLGYSIPTKHGGTSLPLWEFAGWPIHLLGGSPQAQIKIWQHLMLIAEIKSADGNMTMKMATQRCQFWMPGNAWYAKDRHWPNLKEADGERWNDDAPYEAFRRSCENIQAAWRKICST